MATHETTRDSEIPPSAHIDLLIDTPLERLVAACLVARPDLLEVAHVAFGIDSLIDFQAQAVMTAVANLRERGTDIDRESVAAYLEERGYQDIRVWYPKLVRCAPDSIDESVFLNRTASLVRLSDRRREAIEAAEAEIDEFALRDAEPREQQESKSTTAKPKKRKSNGAGFVQLAQKYIGQYANHSHGITLRRWRGDWYRWSEKHGYYTTLSDEQLEADLYRRLQLSKHSEVNEIRHALIAVDDVLIDDIELGTWLDNENPTQTIEIDTAPCRNGILNLPTRSLTPSTPRYFATSALGVAWSPSPPPPAAWLAFLRQLWPSDDESIATLQEWFGYLLTPDTRFQKILLLVGLKRSGKGTIARILSALLGQQNIASPTLASFGTNFGLWPLIGKTAAIIGDARLGSRSDIVQVVERLLSISGEDLQTIDRKHREPWTGKLPTRITIISNELPKLTDASDALAGRMLVLQLEQSFYGKEDPDLTSKLLTELPSILRWAADGWQRLRDRGHFVQPESSKDAIEDLVNLGSPVQAWLRERCETGDAVDPKKALACDAAYADFKQWCETNGHKQVMTSTMFGRDVKTAAQLKRVRQERSANGVFRGVWVYAWLGLKEEEW